ncbi:VOC family protein [Paraburkholderia sp. J67]|uniref:VOC family protein n=1 Tax=Paraburkholderia sp. J67 TaxID=2805435 RepID=UPI002ABE2C77|nr:VOC family protein [Paraburkholderia sp. J67]
MTHARRHDRLGIHSIGEFGMTVPSLDDAHRFYTAFGLDVQPDGAGGLLIRTFGSPHVWGRLREGARKKFDSVTLHCFEDELDALKTRAKEAGVEFIAPPTGADDSGFWIRNPDGMALQIRPGVKTTLDEANHQQPELPENGVRCAPYRRHTAKVQPARMSHIAFATSNVPAQIAFCERVLGLRLSDRSGDGVAFLHAPHGGDHHLFAFAMSSGPAMHHLSWDVPTVEDVGLGYMQMASAGYRNGWGVGRHVLGSNYFYYVQDPWGSFSEYSATMDFIPASVDWVAQDHAPEDGVYLWGPDLPAVFLANSEQGA